MEIALPSKDANLEVAFDAIRRELPSVTDFERDFIFVTTQNLSPTATHQI